uniref:Vacuole membrane protein 1 n=1 Tax=Bicosoecida sp. CB-2014 TaxID=1486930 RepID=A0A7S1G4Q6_9STRA
MDSTTTPGDELRHRLASLGDKGDGEVPHKLHRHHRVLTAEEKAIESVEDAARVSLFTKPLTTLFVFSIIMKDWAVAGVDWLRLNARQVLLYVTLAGLVSLPLVAPPAYFVGARDAIVEASVEHGVYIGYWVLLGILSSVGLGSGLHTFLLFLGPHIIRVTITAAKCGSTDFPVELSQYFPRIDYTDESFACPDERDGADTWAIIAKVRWTAFLWGAGTAIGELPPYFFARAARLSGEKLKELEEVEDDENAPSRELTLMERAKVLMHTAVQRGGFTAILLAASIPNPLFDLAGITCGHFLIPFWTFFGATFIGKAVVKTSLQSLFYVTVFHPHNLQWLRNLLPFEFVADKLDLAFRSLAKACYDVEDASEGAVAACRTCCGDLFANSAATREFCEGECGVEHPPAGYGFGFWMNIVIGGFLLYFAASIIDGLVSERLANEAKRRMERAEKAASSKK